MLELSQLNARGLGSRYTADRLPCLAVKCSKNDHLNLQECTRQLTRMMDLMPSDFAAVNSTLSACAMIPNQPENFTRHDERFNLSTIILPNRASLRLFQEGSSKVTFEVHLEVLSSQNRKAFEYFLCFHRTLGISPKDLEGFLNNRPQVSVGYKLINHVGCW